MCRNFCKWSLKLPFANGLMDDTTVLRDSCEAFMNCFAVKLQVLLTCKLSPLHYITLPFISSETYIRCQLLSAVIFLCYYGITGTYFSYVKTQSLHSAYGY